MIILDTWRKDVKPSDIEDAINSAAPGKIRVISVSQVRLLPDLCGFFSLFKTVTGTLLSVRITIYYL